MLYLVRRKKLAIVDYVRVGNKYLWKYLSPEKVAKYEKTMFEKRLENEKEIGDLKLKLKSCCDEESKRKINNELDHCFSIKCIDRLIDFLL